ncbi:MAG: MFS transporter [Sphingobium sp.]
MSSGTIIDAAAGNVPGMGVEDKARARYALGVFLLIHVFINVDRSVISLVLEPIREEFKVSDSELGQLSVAFAMFFVFFGLPFGRWVDRGVRRNVLVLTTAFFSVMTALGGLASSFAHLLLSRAATGAGEAGAPPAAVSMISDLFPPERRARAMGIFYIGSPLGFILMFSLGGWLAQHLGWRSVFFVAGVPGLALALLAFLTVREPRRGQADALSVDRTVSWTETFRFIVTQPGLQHMMAIAVVMNLLTTAVSVWALSFLVRSHDLSIASGGMIMAIAYGGMGVLGPLLGGWVSDTMSRRNVIWRGMSPAITHLAAMPALVWFLLSPSTLGAAIALGIWAVLNFSLYPPTITLTQLLAPPRMRGTSIAIYYLIAHVAGVGGGPLLAGILSDWLGDSHGVESLRYALLIMSVAHIWSAFHFYRIGRNAKADIERANAAANAI